jgi:peptidoglycan/xylan/chitin deacetylase (PgdA/CDA1 family)
MTAQRASTAGRAGRAQPLASLSLDLDNEWAYLKTHGDAAWEAFPSYLDQVVPQILSLLAQRSLRITVFVVGQDAAQSQNRDALAQIASEAHEIGNHSFRHDPWLHQYSESELDQELSDAEHYIEAATGHRPVAFRGPGFSLSEATLRVLVRRGYQYDASTLPSFLGPVARAYYLATGRFDAAQRGRLEQLFGDWREGLRPLKPYQWRVGDDRLLEMPVTTFPGFRVPIHLTYVMYLAGISRQLAAAYFRMALRFCRISGVEPSLLLHPLDFLGGEDVPRLSFFPSMGLGAPLKRSVLEDCLDALQQHFEVCSLGEHAAVVTARGGLALADYPRR